MSKEKRPRRAVVGAILGILGGLWALSSTLMVGGLIFAAALGGSTAWFVLGLFSWVLPPVITIISIIASVLMLARRYKAGGVINVISSLVILMMFSLFIVGSILVGGRFSIEMLPAITFFWIGPFILLLTSGVCGLSSGKLSKA